MTHFHDGVECAEAHGVTDADAVAHGRAPVKKQDRALVAIFASPVSDFLLRYAADAGYRVTLVEPDPERAAKNNSSGADVVTAIGTVPDEHTDVVVTDHHRDEIGVLLRDALASPARWIGIMGSPRHDPPHIQALTLLGVPPDEIARVHRPIGLNIGSRAPAEIAIATLAGLIADRNGRPGGFDFA
jgi:xanthine dehydrogenase accessory factor